MIKLIEHYLVKLVEIFTVLCYIGLPFGFLYIVLSPFFNKGN